MTEEGQTPGEQYEGHHLIGRWLYGQRILRRATFSVDERFSLNDEGLRVERKRKTELEGQGTLVQDLQRMWKRLAHWTRYMYLKMIDGPDRVQQILEQCRKCPAERRLLSDAAYCVSQK